MLAHLPSPASGRAAPRGPAPLRAPRGIVATLARRETRRLIASFRFRALSALILVLLILPALTASAKYRGERRAHTAAVADYEALLRGATVDDLAELRHPALRPAWRLAFAVDGGQSATPDLFSQALSPYAVPELRRVQPGNDRLPSPAPLDWMFTIRVVLSLAAFLLGYDAICGEREAGTLKLVLSYPVPRWKILLSKLAAVWVCLAVPVVLGTLGSVLLLRGLGEVPLAGEELLKAGLVVLLALWAAAFFALLALLVSAATRSSSTSLSVLTLLWVGTVVVLPALGGLLAHRLAPIPSEGEIEQRMRAADRRIAQRYAGREGRWRAPEWAEADGYSWERVSARAETERGAIQDGIRRWMIDRKIEQARVARDLAAVSPPALVQDLAERLTGSGLWRDRAFLDQARAFRQVLGERVRRLDGADPASPHILFFRGYLSRRAVAPREIPRFRLREVPVAEALGAARPALAVLGLETVLLAALALFVFVRHEPG